MSLAWQSVSPYVPLIACIVFYGRPACLRRLPFLFRQEREERTGQGGGRFRISPPALDSPLIQTAKGDFPFGFPSHCCLTAVRNHHNEHRGRFSVLTSIDR